MRRRAFLNLGAASLFGTLVTKRAKANTDNQLEKTKIIRTPERSWQFNVAKSFSQPSVSQPILDSGMTLYENMVIYRKSVENVSKLKPNNEKDLDNYIQGLADTTARAMTLPFAYALPLATNKVITESFNLLNFLEEYGIDKEFMEALEPITGFHTQTYFLKLFNVHSIHVLREIIANDLKQDLSQGQDIKNLSTSDLRKIRKYYSSYIDKLKKKIF